MIKFLEINGKNFKRNLLNINIVKFCSNLKSLLFNDIKSDFQWLSTIWTAKSCSKKLELLDIVAKYSPITFRELIITF